MTGENTLIDNESSDVQPLIEAIAAVVKQTIQDLKENSLAAYGYLYSDDFESWFKWFDIDIDWLREEVLKEANWHERKRNISKKYRLAG